MQTKLNETGAGAMASLAGTWAVIVATLPRVLAFLLILIIGWFVASLVAKGVALLLRKVNFNEMAQRSGFSDFVAKMGINTDAAGFLALVVKWFVRLIALVVAFDALGLPAVSDVLRQLLLWLPNLVVALVVLVIAGLLGNALASLVRGATAKAGFSNPEFVANLARTAVWVFAVVVAINQLGIATTLINTLFMGVVGALALALGLAFGLGGRDTADEIVRNWYQRGRAAQPQLREAADAAQQDARRMAQQSGMGQQPGTMGPPTDYGDRGSNPGSSGSAGTPPGSGAY
jgi:small-conductance mechanosensitive channel